jgi:hypothetical protein
MPQPTAENRTTRPESLVVAILGCALLVLALRLASARDGETVDLTALPASTTETTIAGAPPDPSPEQAPGGTVVHPRSTVPVYDDPDGTPFAKLRPQHFGDAWFPVIARLVDWVQVLLPSRPNGSTGWIRTDGVETRTTTTVVRVHLASRSLELVEDGEVTDTWTVGIGADTTPTPTGRTFILGQLVDDQQSWSPAIIPLGTHSRTLDSLADGPGTVALHGWTDPSVLGRAVSRGCVRVPDDALDRLLTLPLGTPVLIDDA